MSRGEDREERAPGRLRLRSVPVSALEWSAGGEGASDAPLVMLLHGFPDAPVSWTPVATRLAEQGYRVVAPYLPGYVPSSCDLPLDLVAVAEVLQQALEELSPDRPAYVVGHDWGAATTYPLLRLTGARVARAATMAVPFLGAMATNLSLRQARRSWYMMFFQTGPLADHVVQRNDFALVRRLWRDWSPDYRCPEDQMREILDCLAASMPHPVRWYRSQMALTGAAGARRVQVQRGLSQPIDTPLLYLHGRNDGCIGPELAEGQARFFPAGYRERVLDGCGHFLQVEQPDAVADELIAWFAER